MKKIIIVAVVAFVTIISVNAQSPCDSLKSKLIVKTSIGKSVNDSLPIITFTLSDTVKPCGSGAMILTTATQTGYTYYLMKNCKPDSVISVVMGTGGYIIYPLDPHSNLKR